MSLTKKINQKILNHKFEKVHHTKNKQNIPEVTIRFAGDSGDGMQLTGNRFSNTIALSGNSLSTFSDFPAEIRAPQGTIAGVSAFQIHFSSKEIKTPGDQTDILVAMNPAALKSNLKYVKKNGLLLLNEDAFTESDIKKAGFDSDPRKNSTLSKFKIISVPINSLVLKALDSLEIKDKDKDRSKNMFALGIVYWLFGRDIASTTKWLQEKFKKSPLIAEANILSLKAGYYFAETTELLPVHFHIQKAKLQPGTYRNITGNEALSLGLIASSELSGIPLFLGTYPITPASDILHYLSKHKNFKYHTFQAEDEIAASSAAIGASFAGFLGVSTTSGPGFTLKSESINFAIMAELPLVIINLQRGGPSTGLPTKTEQTDLLQIMFGRNGESPLCVIAARSPSDCFYKIIEAFQIAVKYMVPVVLCSDAFLANSSGPWRLPSKEELPSFDVTFRDDPKDYAPYIRNPNTLARDWVRPGTIGMEHRIGGLEKEDITGNVSYDPENHEQMVYLRAKKVSNIQKFIPKAKVIGKKNAKNLIIGWGSTYGSIKDAVDKLILKKNIEIAYLHLDYISPFPSNTESILTKYERIFAVELNTGQLAFLLQGTYGIKVEKINSIQGRPFRVDEIMNNILNRLY